MKITGPGGINQTGKVKKKSLNGSDDFSAYLSETDEAASSPSIAAPASMSAMGALLALQEVGTGAVSAKEYGEQLLSQLDNLRYSLLSGEMNRSDLEQLKEATEQSKEETIDPRIREILEEIELRAMVELAKYGS